MVKKKHVNVLVTLRFYDFEGGFWGLVDENGKQWLPINLTDYWTSQGDIKVLVSFTVNEKLVSLVNWGTPVEIIEIKNS
jgi:hypothetical protein